MLSRRVPTASIAMAVILVSCLPELHLRSRISLPPGFGEPGFAQGVVFHDVNGNGERDQGEPGLEGIRVSDQRSVTVTDKRGTVGASRS